MTTNYSMGRAPVNSAARMLRAPVCTGSGELVGHVDDMLINTATGKIECLSVRPTLKMGSMCVRLNWKDVRVNRLRDGLIIIPGTTAVKRLIIRARHANREDAVH